MSVFSSEAYSDRDSVAKAVRWRRSAASAAEGASAAVQPALAYGLV